MKKMMLVAVSALLSTAAWAQSAGYSVVAKGFDQVEGEKVYLYRFDGGNPVAVDSAVVKGGAFTFKGDATGVEGYRLVSKGLKERRLAEFILENGNITLTRDAERVTVGGSVANEGYAAYNKALEPTIKRVREIAIAVRDTTVTEEQRNALIEEYYGLQDKMTAVASEHMELNINNRFGAYLLKSQGREFDAEKVVALIEKMPKEYCDEGVQEVKKFAEIVIKTQPGKPMTDFTQNAPDGTPVTLSAIVKQNKYTLVDFWASWCGPCRKDMPHLVKVYEQYKSKGLEIVGVSLDDKEALWKKGLETLKMTWVQMSDLKGWRNEGAGLYAVRGIPATVLIDQNGIIVARDLRGEELDAKLAELLP